MNDSPACAPSEQPGDAAARDAEPHDPGLLQPPPAGRPPSSPPELEQVTAKAVRYIKAKRGGDLAAILLTGSATRQMLMPHSDVNLMVLVRGTEGRHELVRIQDRLVEIRYLGLATADEQLKASLRLPATLRKARVLFEFEAAGSHYLEQAQTRFRQGTPSLTLHEKIRVRADALHWLGKADDHREHPAMAQYLFSIYLDECINAFYYLRGFWLPSAQESLRFIGQRDPSLEDLLHQALVAPELPLRLELGRRIAQHLFKEIPSPARID
jgi:predicted nucleotidyltransferase